ERLPPADKHHELHPGRAAGDRRRRDLDGHQGGADGPRRERVRPGGRQAAAVAPVQEGGGGRGQDEEVNDLYRSHRTYRSYGTHKPGRGSDPTSSRGPAPPPASSRGTANTSTTTPTRPLPRRPRASSRRSASPSRATASASIPIPSATRSARPRRGFWA